MGTCSETICKHRILFPSIQHLAWLPQGRPQGKQKWKEKCGKNSDFWTYALTWASYNSETIEDRWIHAVRLWQALNCLFIHVTFCVIATGASPVQTKNEGRVRKNDNFLAIMVRITGKLLKIDGYMLRGGWQALNCLSIHATYCVIITGASPGETKMWAAVRENGGFLHLRFE